jgi:hypothetical protein
MATLTTTMTYSNQTVGNFTNWAKPFGSAFSTLGWVNTNDFGSIQGTATYGSATISNVQINNGVLQITYTGATNQFTSGQALLLTGLTTNTFLNNQIVRIQNITSPLSLYTTSIFNPTITSVAASVGGNATYSLVNTTNVVSNLENGTTVTITGMTNLSNNGTFAIVSSGGFSITVNNPNAVAETHAGSITALALTKNTAYSAASVAASVGTTAVYTIPAPALSAIPNFYAGATFIVTGFTNLSNNGTFVCTASNAASLTLYNSNAVAETYTATLTQQPDATNTVFTAYFSHADVAPVADTGTATIVYGWNTVTNVPDLVTNATTASFPIGHSIRWRGAYVGITPIFTNLQTTANMTTISFGANGHGFDLTYSKGLSVLINGVTNVAFTWLNESVSGFLPWPIEALTSTTIVINTGASPRADIASTPVSAGIASPGYQGGAQASTGVFGESVCDVVTYNGDLYIACSGSLVGGAYLGNSANVLITIPGTGTAGSKFWSRFAYDMWKSNDALTSTNPIVFKVLYGNDTGSRPIFYFYWGCATDGTGNITTNYNWGPNQVFSPATGGSTGVSTIGPNTGTTDTAPWESDFSGAPGRFACIPWRGYTQGISGPQFLLNIERSHDNSGNDTDAYWTVLFIGQPDNGVNSVTGNWFAMTQSIFKPGTGGAGPQYAIPNGQGNTLNNTIALSPLPTINIPNATSLSFNNSIPVLPVFPLVGYVGNPMIGTIIMKAGDTSDGALVTASFYGTSHPYLMCTRGGCAAAGPFMVNNSPGFNSAMGIRWE